MSIETQEATRTVVPTFTMRASQLRDALHVHVAAGRDGTLPTLTGVHVSWSDGEPVVFAATDRYRLAVATTETVGVGDGVFLMCRKDAIELIKLLPKSRRGALDSEVTVTVTKDHVTFFMVHDGSTMSREYRTLDGEYPKYKTLMNVEAKPTQNIAWNPVFMADVAKLPMERNLPVKWTFAGETRPAMGRWTCQDIEWEYLLMPVRLH